MDLCYKYVVITFKINWYAFVEIRKRNVHRTCVLVAEEDLLKHCAGTILK
jgi:hypothetical protein